jgi:hypothetical protein
VHALFLEKGEDRWLDFAATDLASHAHQAAMTETSMTARALTRKAWMHA